MTDNYKRDFRAAFEFLDRWKPFPGSLEEWEAAAREVGAVYAQNGKSPLLCDLLVAVYDELGRQYKIKQEGTVEQCG